MDSHFSPVDEFDYVPDDLKELTPAWLPQGQGRVAMVTPNWPEAPLGRGLARPHLRFQGDFDVDSRLRDMDAMGIERQLLNRQFWPFYDVAIENNVPISVHAHTRDWGTVCDPKRMGDSWGFFVATLADYMTITCCMIYSGVFDQFPDLKFCLGEGGATWLPWM